MALAAYAAAAGGAKGGAAAVNATAGAADVNDAASNGAKGIAVSSLSGVVVRQALTPTRPPHLLKKLSTQQLRVNSSLV